jgi:type I restriction enzyme S subunit
MPEQLTTGWEWQKLEEIAEINSHNTEASLPESTKVSFVPMAAVSEMTASIVEAETRPLSEVQRGFTRFREGDVLFAKITPCMENGKVAIACNLVNGLGFGSTEFHVIRPFPGVSHRWVWYFLRSSGTRKYAAQNMTGSAGQRRVPTNFMRMLQIPMPISEEQKRMQEHIINLLDEIDAARHLCDLIQKEVEYFTSALFITMFGDPETNPKEWEVVSLGDKGCVIGFTYGTNMRSTEQSVGTPILRVPNILRGNIDVDNLKYADLSVKEQQKLALQQGDVLVVRSNGNPGYIGRGAAYQGSPPRAAFASYLIRIRPVPAAFDGEYLSAWLRSSNGRRQLLNQAKTTAGQYNLSTEGLRRLRVPRPPLTLQKKFVAILNEVRSWQQIQRAKYEELGKMLYALLGNLFAARSQAVVVPIQPQIAIDRIIWPNLSITQRHLWEASQTLPASFKIEELRERMLVQQGKAPNSEYTLTAMELLEVLTVAIKENRGDVEKWHLPNDETDPDVEV